MHHRQNRHMVIRAVEMGVWQRQGKAPVILPSDLGSQFTSGDYRRFPGSNRVVCTISRYVSTAEPEPKIDLRAVNQQLQDIEKRATEERAKHNRF